MSSLFSTVDKKITTILETKKFTISAEIIPPRNGEDQEVILNQIHQLVDCGVDFLSVTKGAGGSLRGGSLPIALAIKDRFAKPCIAHFTCRDLLPEEVENQLVDHHYFGIRNILALRGDPPLGVEEWQSRPGGHSYAYQLIEQIVDLNKGHFKKRKGFDSAQQKPTEFCIGAAVYPEHPDIKERIEFFQKKIEAGAEWAITQMIFNPDVYEEFLNLCAKNKVNIPILPGMRVLTNQKQALNMTKRFGCSLPQEYIKLLPEQAGVAHTEQILDAFFWLLNKFKSLQVPGVHFFVLNDTDLAVKSIKRAL